MRDVTGWVKLEILKLIEHLSLVVIMSGFHVQTCVRTPLSQMALYAMVYLLKNVDTSTARILETISQMSALTGHIPVDIASKGIPME